MDLAAFGLGLDFKRCWGTRDAEEASGEEPVKRLGHGS